MPARLTRRCAVSAVAAVAVAGLSPGALPSGDAAASKATSTAPRAAAEASSPLSSSGDHRDRKGAYDARLGTTRTQLRQARHVVGDRGKAFDAYARSLGRQAVIDYDPATGTPADLSRLDGFLTTTSAAPATTVAMSYVRAHLAALGLTRSDLQTFALRRDYVDVAGIHHLSYTQSIQGIPLFGNGLKANVTGSGQLISLQGSPVSGLADLAATTDDPADDPTDDPADDPTDDPADSTPELTAGAARRATAEDVGGTVSDSARLPVEHGVTTWKNHDTARLVYFLTRDGMRQSWATYVQAESGDVDQTLNYQDVIDADTGAVLYRHDTTSFDRGDAHVYENYPGAPVGGKRTVANLYDAGYLDRGQDNLLNGNYARAWADVDDDNNPGDDELVDVPGTSNDGHPQYELTPFNKSNASGLCSRHFVCTWDPNEAGSWSTNLQEDVTEAFWHDSNYHDYLQKRPIGFTPDAGNFEATGGDPVLLNALDGADTDDGLPDGSHLDNANMSTPPDGTPPTMQMYLFHAPNTSDDKEPFLPTSSAFDPSVIYHEYTHGLSNRLVVDADGNSTLNSIQAGSMGEAWSDYYAMDYLVKQGLEADTRKSGEVLLGKYLKAGQQPFRTMAIDCAVKTRKPACTVPGHTGGYTYGDFPTVGGTPEVHASGEIWAQTLWDLRKRLGHRVADMVITRGMELSTADPTFLDMRNAIVQADLAVYAGEHRHAIWKTFAKRGMGWYAAALDGQDAYPVEDFHLPPAPRAPRSTVAGQVLDHHTGQPVANALVTIVGHDSGYTGDYSAVTDESGRYAIPDVYLGTYPLVAVFGSGYEVLQQALTVTRGGTNADFEPRRDWASSAGGGAVTDFNGPDYTDYGCGPSGAVDLSQGSGWGSTTGDDDADPTNVMIPKHVTVALPQAITLDGLAVNPSNTCGDPGSSSTGDYRVETSPDATTWTTLKQGTFSEDERVLEELTVADPVTDVRYVRFTMLSPQVPDFGTNCPDGGYAGCQFTDMTELEVFGAE